MDELEFIAGKSRYVYREVDKRKCIVLKTDPTNLDFTFQEKHDMVTKRNFFVNLSHGVMVWELPDVTNLPPIEKLPKVIVVQCTEYEQVVTNIGRPTFAPSNMPVELSPVHYWVAELDEAIRKYVFINACPNIKGLGVRTELPATSDFCQRIQRYFSHYKLGTKDECTAFIVKNAGQEENALMALIEAHGEEPEEYLKNKNQLLAILNKYAPEKITNVISLLDKNEGKEDALISKMSKKYGKKPLSYLERAEFILKGYAPEKLDKLPDFMSVFSGREEGFIWALCKRYNTEELSSMVTSSPPISIRNEIVHYAMKYAPAKDKVNVTFESLLSKWSKTTDPKGKLLLASIKETYGDELTNAELDAFYNGFIGDQHSKTYRERLINMYRKYQPDKLDDVDKTLARYNGQEEKMLESFVETLGPEPTDEEMEAIYESLGTPRKSKRKKKVSLEQSPGVPEAGAGDLKDLDVSSHAKFPVTTEVPDSPPEYLMATLPQTSTTGISAPTVSEVCQPTITQDSPSDGPIHVLTETFVVDHRDTDNFSPIREEMLRKEYDNMEADDRSQLMERDENTKKLSSEEIRNRVINLLTVHEPQMLDVLPEVLKSIKNGENGLYMELLEKYKTDPTDDELKLAKEKVAADAQRCLTELQEREAASKKTLEDQDRRIMELIRELEQAKAFEMERCAKLERQQKELLISSLKEEEALGDLAVVEARRKAAEVTIEDLLRRSKFAESLQETAERLLSAEMCTPSVGTNALVLIQSLSTLEEKLQRAYNIMETSIRKGDTLRASNEELNCQINELKGYISENEKRVQIAMMEAQNDTLRRQNDHEKEKLSIQGEEQEIRRRTLEKYHKDQQVMSEERVKLAQETRELRNEVEKQREVVREQERIIGSLEIKYDAKVKEELDARSELRILKEKMLLLQTKTEKESQTDSDEYLLNQKEIYNIQEIINDVVIRNPSWMPHYNYKNYSSLDQLRAILSEIELDFAHWRQSVASLRDKCEEATHERRKLEEEYGDALRVISILRNKNQNLESKINDIVNKLTKYQSNTSTNNSCAIMDTNDPKSPRLNFDALNHHVNRLETSELGLKLTYTEAESKALRKEICDLRGLLAIHMSSPKGQR